MNVMKGERTLVRGMSRLAGAVALLFSFCAFSPASDGLGAPVGYRAVTEWGDAVLACGTGDRIHILDSGGSIVSSVPLDTVRILTDIAAIGESALCIGDDGAVLLLENGSATALDFYGIRPQCAEAFRGCFLLACDGAIFTLDRDLSFVNATARLTRGSIISMSAYGDSRVCALSDEGEFIFSSDGQSWEYLDFNREYEGYYPELRPVCVAAGAASYALVGSGPDGRPLLFLSSTGTVWNPRELTASEYALDESVNRLVYDPWGDRMVLLCSGGTVFYVPGCSHCNSFKKTRADNLYHARPVPGSLMVFGDDSFVTLL